MPRSLEATPKKKKQGRDSCIEEVVPILNPPSLRAEVSIPGSEPVFQEVLPSASGSVRVLQGAGARNLRSNPGPSQEALYSCRSRTS